MEKTKFWTRKLSTKTFVISHLFIFFLGLIFIFLFSFFINQGLSVKKNWDSNLPVTSKPRSFSLELASPDDNLFTTDSALVVSGKTSPNALVAISLNDDDLVIQAKESGDFTKVINLNTGLNEATISSFDENGVSKSETRSIYYSKEKL